MNPSDIIPRWIRELERLSAYKTQLYLYGNTKDTLFYPLGSTQQDWTLGPMREALFELLRHRLGPYDVIGAYNLVDGMVFADARDENAMAGIFDEMVGDGEKFDAQAPKGRAPQASKPKEPIEQAIQQIRSCLRNRQHPCAFILEHASQMLTTPVNLQQAERLGFLRLLMSSSESQLIAVGEGNDRRIVQNMLIFLCDKLTDLPPWLYFNNPFAGSIMVEAPRGYERRHFFNMFLPPAAQTGTSQFEVNDLVDLTDGMTIRDLCGIRTLARRMDNTQTNAKSLVDCYKYGVQESEWDNLDWSRLENAEETLSKRVMGQPAAVSAVADMLRRARLHLSGAQHSSRTKPRGVLFFAGPTGVGKTELAKAIAELIFRTEDACVRFDMSEFSQPQADQRLLGAPPGYIGYEEGGQLTNRVKTNPFSVLLFDEIEKAHPSILDKFLQILEDGRMTDGRGETVYFAESIIIFTSNVGIYQLDQMTGRPAVDPFTGQPVLQVDPNIDTEYSAVQAKVLDGVQGYFKHILGRPELLNRIGQNIIVFDFIRLPIMRQILEHKVLRSIHDQVKERWNVQVDFSPTVVDQVMEIIGSDISAGGRGVGNLAESVILNPLARVLFKLLDTGESLTGKRLLVNSVLSPDSSEEHCYNIQWQLDDCVAEV